jgi:hypothetical protein
MNKFKNLSYTRVLSFCACLFIISACTSHSSHNQQRPIKSKLDSSKLHVSGIAKSTPIHIHRFSTNRVSLNSDTAQSMANSAPHLLATDIVYALRANGFTNVTLDESVNGANSGTFNLVGAFTKLDPGSQNLRVWIGFGAGESEVCTDGQLNDAQGKVIANFSHCETGLGWGDSGPQLEAEAKTMGEKIGQFLSMVAN